MSIKQEEPDSVKKKIVAAFCLRHQGLHKVGTHREGVCEMGDVRNRGEHEEKPFAQKIGLGPSCFPEQPKGPISRLKAACRILSESLFPLRSFDMTACSWSC